MEAKGIVAGRFTLHELLGVGAFCKVYLARDKVSNQDVAMKIEHQATSTSMIAKEVSTMQSLAGCEGVPDVIWSGKYRERNAYAMNLLGGTLLSLLKPASAVPLGCLFAIAISLLKTLKSIHNRGYLHLDIKPDNILQDKSAPKLYLIDYGISLKFCFNDVHYPYSEDFGFRGNPAFASTNVLFGVKPGRRDDLESLAFVLSFLRNKELPWSRQDGKTVAQWKADVIRKRANYPGERLFAGCPPEFANFYTYLKSLKFDEKPNYRMLRNQFRDGAERELVSTSLNFSFAGRRSQRTRSISADASPSQILEEFSDEEVTTLLEEPPTLGTKEMQALLHLRNHSLKRNEDPPMSPEKEVSGIKVTITSPLEENAAANEGENVRTKYRQKTQKAHPNLFLRRASVML